MSTDRATGSVDPAAKRPSTTAYTPSTRHAGTAGRASVSGSTFQVEPADNPASWLARSAVLLFLAASGFERTKFLHGDLLDPFSTLKLLWGVDRTAFYYLAALNLLAAISAAVGVVLFARFVRTLAGKFRSRPTNAPEFSAAIAKYALAKRPGRPKVVSHWHHCADHFNTSTVEFFDLLSKELEAIAAPIQISRVEWNESGVHSAKRQYLRIELNRLIFDVCAAPFGRTFFFSWWLAERQPKFPFLLSIILLAVFVPLTKVSTTQLGTWAAVKLSAVVLVGAWIAFASGSDRIRQACEDLILTIPGLSHLYRRFVKPPTYYSADTRLVFEETVHNSVLRVVDVLLNARGARALASEERKPSVPPRL